MDEDHPLRMECLKFGHVESMLLEEWIIVLEIDKD